MTGPARAAVSAAIGRLISRTSSTGWRAASRSFPSPSSKPRTKCGSHAVATATGRNISVWKSRVGTAYQPTTSLFVSSDSITKSIQR